MSRFITLFVALVFLLQLPRRSESAAPDESKEPPLTYSVRIGDKSVTTVEGETARFEGTFTNPEVTIAAQQHRMFPYQGVSFKYPRSFTFEADLSDPDAKIWTLSGNDFKIMYFVLNTRLTAADFARTMINQFGKQSSKVLNGSAKTTLGKHTLLGATLRATLATHSMIMEIYGIPTPGARTKLLVFQDSLDDSGNRSQEGKATLQVFRSSFDIER